MPFSIDVGLYLSCDHIHPDPITVGELRHFVTMLDSFNVADDVTLDECNLMLTLDLTSASIETVTCSDCSPKSIVYNTLIDTHACPNK